MKKINQLVAIFLTLIVLVGFGYPALADSSVETIISRRAVSVMVQPFAYDPASGNWNYRFEWKGLSNRSGSIMIDRNVFVPTLKARASGEQFTGFSLKPGQAYEVSVRSLNNGKGARLYRSQFTTIAAPAVPEVGQVPVSALRLGVPSSVQVNPEDVNNFVPFLWLNGQGVKQLQIVSASSGTNSCPVSLVGDTGLRVGSMAKSLGSCVVVVQYSDAVTPATQATFNLSFMSTTPPVVVSPTPTQALTFVTNGKLRPGMVGTPYDQSVTYRYSGTNPLNISAINVPDGMTATVLPLVNGEGQVKISGIPMRSGLNNITLTGVVSGQSAVSAQLALPINTNYPVRFLTTNNLSDATTGVTYRKEINYYYAGELPLQARMENAPDGMCVGVGGGSGAQCTTGDLPTNISGTHTIQIQGAPTVPGRYEIMMILTDGGDLVSSYRYTLVVR